MNVELSLELLERFEIDESFHRDFMATVKSEGEGGEDDDGARGGRLSLLWKRCVGFIEGKNIPGIVRGDDASRWSPSPSRDGNNRFESMKLTRYG